MADQANQESHSSGRWWEFYVVRYGMGSVVGAVIFFFLCNTNPVLRTMLFGAEAGKIDGTLLGLLAGYGLAYCYIASAPILVLHVCRFLLQMGGGTAQVRRISILMLPPLLASVIFYFTRSIEGIILNFYALIFLLSALILWPQYLAIGIALFKTKELLKFYQKLANKRELAKGGIVDSYKHMREHGNSFSIVLLEIILAMILYVAGNFEASSSGEMTSNEAYIIPYVLIIIVWIVPAAFVWLIGTLFEREFSGI